MTLVWYVEARGERSHEQLQHFMQQLCGQSGFLGAELLLSPGQPGLVLVVSRWRSAVPDLPLPASARGWVFTVEASVASGPFPVH